MARRQQSSGSGQSYSSFTLSAAPGQTLDTAGEIFAWQHDPESLGGELYSWFDNESAGAANTGAGAVEELLRLHSTANPDRRVTRDLEVGGVAMKAGDRIWFPLALINRDERTFTNADTADFSRMPNPHFTFGAGPHRCLGSHLARRELNLLLEAWIKRIPSFRLAAGTTLRHHNLVFGIDKIPLVWDVR